MRIDEVESRETQLEHKEKRLAEEKTFYEQQLKQLEGELEKQRAELLASKREAGHKLAGLSQVSHHRLHYWLMISNLFILQDLASQTEEARNALRSKNILMEESQEFQTRAEDLAEKLRDSRESERKLEEKFRAELAAQTRLANLYKSYSEEHNNKLEDLKKVVTNLQNMLKESNRKQEELLENVDNQVSDITTAGLNVSADEGSCTNSQLRALIKYLRYEKDISAGMLEVEEAETARLRIQLDNLKKELEEARTAAASTSIEEKQKQKSLSVKGKKQREQFQEFDRLDNNNDAEDSIDEDSEDIDVESPLHPTLKRTRDDILRDTTVPMSSYDDQEKESSEDDDSVVQQKKPRYF